MRSPGPHPGPSALEPTFEQGPGWFLCAFRFETCCSGPVVPQRNFPTATYIKILLGKRILCSIHLENVAKCTPF